MTTTRFILLLLATLGASAFGNFQLKAQPPVYPDAAYTGLFRQETGWQAGDATISVPLPDGRVLWLFGDSYVNSAFNPADTSLPCLFNRNNAVVIQSALDPADLSYHMTFIPPTLGRFYWPGKGFYYNNKVYIFLFERNALAFVGSSCVELSYPELQLLNTYSVPTPESIEFGKGAFLDEAGGWLYVYGNKPYPAFGSNRYFVSRCALGNLLQSWEYWDGNSWAMQPNTNNPLLPTGIGCPSFTAFPYNGAYYILSQDNGYLTCGLGRDIRLYASNAPTGPFNYVTTVYTIEDTYNGIYLATYNAQAHPGLGGDLLVSYNVADPNFDGSGCPRQCNTGTTRNADTYRPRFIRVPLTVLPVEWLTFAAIDGNSKVVLEWSVASETGNSHYEVERSRNGTIFETIGSVPGAGNSNRTLSYSFRDEAPHTGQSYYRLKQLDFDGKATYSKVVSVKRSGKPEWSASLYPNPGAGGVFFIHLPNASSSGIEVRIHTTNGRQVFAQRYSVEKGETISIQTAPVLSSGVYWVQILQEDEVSVHKLKDHFKTKSI